MLKGYLAGWRLVACLVWVFLLGIHLAPSAHGKDWDPRLKQALEQSYSGQAQNGLTLVKAYQKENPRDPNGYFVEAMVKEWQAGLGPANHREVYSELVKIYGKANQMAFFLWEKDPENVDRLVDLGNSYFLLARIYGQQGKKLKAGLTGKKCQRHLEKALEMAPERWDIYLPLGAFHFFAGNTPDYWKPIRALLGIKGEKDVGLKELKQSLKGNHPYIFNSYYALMEIHQKAEKNWQEALKYWAFFAENFPNNPLVALKKAQILELKDRREAIAAYLAFAEACQSQKTCAKKFVYLAYSQAGRLHHDLKEPGPAKQYYQLALKWDPGDYPDRRKEIQAWQQVLAQEP